MQLTVEIGHKRRVEVTQLWACCGVRYWEDAIVNGVEDEDGSRIPCRVGDDWCPTIDLATGVIKGWPPGTTAKVHYKVCDDGKYGLLDADGNVVVSITGYVPRILSASGRGFGDYVVMDIDGNGRISGWNPDLSPWEA